MDLNAFFLEERIDVFSQVGIRELPARDQVQIEHMLPGARSVIVFGKEVPVGVYLMPPAEKTREMLRIAESLDRSANQLVQHLDSEDVPACPVPLYLPVTIRDGKVMGIVRLKLVAAAAGLGTPGKSSLLISPRYGPRLLLSGVVTTSRPPESGSGDETIAVVGSVDSSQCNGCGRCIRACPGGVFGPDGVDAFRCSTVREWVHPFLVPGVKWFLRRQLFMGIAAPLAPHIARIATIRCSLCVTECPLFSRN